MALFVSFFVYALLHPMSYVPKFCQMKDLIKIYICSKFHHYSICGCVVKSFQFFLHWFSIHGIFPFGFFLGAYSPNYCLILLRFWAEVSSNETNTVFEKSFRILNFSLNRSMMEQFCSILWPNLLLENQKCCWKPTFPQKLHP